jgi:hypothetical protein
MAKIDEYASKVLDVILEHEGVYSQGDAGEVLGNLAHESEVPYKAVSVVVLYLESLGFVEVDRVTHREAHRANKIASIKVI